jgi:RHS repeat-associated protein
VADLQVKNLNASAISSDMVLVVDGLSNAELSLLQPDGYYGAGVPYLMLRGNGNDRWLASGQSTEFRELRFKNPNKTQFQASFRVLAKINLPPAEFDASPLLEIEAGRAYESSVRTSDPDQQSLTYSKVVGPAGMAIDPSSGVILWPTSTLDTGNHSVKIRATDPFGLYVDLTFSIAVTSSLPNRPPVFTSTPPTEAIVERPFEILTYSTGPSPVAAVAGDFGSGHLSVIAATPGSQALNLLNGTGNEQFGSATPISVGEIDPSHFSTPFVTGASVNLGFSPNTYSNIERNVLSIVHADVNDDGYLDFGVTIDSNGSEYSQADIGAVGVRLGNGDGTFRDGWQTQLPAVTLGSSGFTPRADSIRFGDVNGDNRLDFIAIQSFGSRALVYLGNGIGSFSTTPIVSTSTETFSYSYSSQLGDINNDGKLDLISFESQFDSRFRAGTHVRLGDGEGRFANGIFYPNTNNNSGDGYLSDVNGDGKLDTVRLNYSDARIESRINNGLGLLSDLQFSQTYFVDSSNVRGPQSNPTSGYLGDYNQDGKTDIVVSTATTAFILLTGNNDGTFGDGTQQGNRFVPVNDGPYYYNSTQNFPSLGRSDGIAPDLNADGVPDFVFGNQQVAQLTTAVNDGFGAFTTQVYHPGFSDDIGNGSVRGQNPTPHISVGDFNNDGVADVLMGRDQSNGSRVRVGGVGIALGGNEPGSLRLPKVTLRGSENIDSANGSQVLSDFDNDGILDIASSIRSGVAIAKGREDGTFDTYQTGFNQFGVFTTSSLVASDFDRDGNMDIAYFASINTPGHAPSMTILFGLGNGTFQRAAASVPSGLFGSGTISQQYGVAADINGDRYPDLIYRVPNNHSNFATAKSLVVYLYDPADRNLKLITDRDSLLVTAHRGGFYQDEVVAFEDLNGDGMKELVAHSGAFAQNEDTRIPERLTIWQPTYNTTATDAADLFTRLEFTNPGISPGLGVEGSINALLVADYNHDQKPDIAVGSQNGTTRVLFGNGDFTYRNPVTYSTNQVTGLRTADVNGDGYLDIIPIWSGFYNYNDLNNTGVLLGRSDGSFGIYQGLTTAGYDLNSPIPGDFNQDGREDINYGNYGLSRLTVLAASPGLASVATGDLNGDGILDIVAMDTGFARLKILQGNGHDTFSRQKDLFTGLQPESVLLHDINGDGSLDILSSNRVGKSISLFVNNGSGAFTRTDLALNSQPNQLAIGDLNGDERADIIVTSKKSQSLSTFLSTATGFAPLLEQPIGFAAADLLFSDITLDGNLDAILSDPEANRIVTLPGRGNGVYGVPLVQPLQLTPDKIAVADLNSDGKPDIVATFPKSNQVGIMFGRGSGRLTTPQLLTVGETPASISVSDINDDSRPDLIVSNQGDNTLSVIVNRYDPSSVYRYTLSATDPDADPIAFDLLDAPGGALYDETTQSIVWAPMPDQVGRNQMVVQASDGRGGLAEQGFSITVSSPDSGVSPSFTSEPIVEISSDEDYVYQPRISNPSNGPVRFSLTDAPAGATIDPVTGVVTWDPRENGISLGVKGQYGFPNNIENRGTISIPSSPSINTVNFTAEGWYRFDSLDNATLFRKYHSSFYNSWTVSNFFGTLRAEINNFGSTPDVRLDTIRLTTNTWYHIAFSYDDTTRLAQMFVNGQLVGSTQSTGTPQLSDGALSVDGFEGTVANMRLWNRSLTTQQVQDAMLNPIASNAPGLVIDYHFAEGPSALSFVDASSYGNHGSLSIIGDFSRYNFPERVASIARSQNVPFSIRVDDGKGGIATQSFTVTTLPPFAKSIEGTVFDDINGNGIKDAVNEPGLAGQMVFVDQNGNNQRDEMESQAITDALGNYTLQHKGTHANVVLVGTPGRIQSSPIQPSQFVSLSNANAIGVHFGSKVVSDGPPKFISTSSTTAIAMSNFRYQAYAQSTNGSSIQYAMVVGPTRASIDPTNGLFQWTPALADVGTVDVILRATDSEGRMTMQSFQIVVSISTSPVITSVAAGLATQDVLYHYDVHAQDAEQTDLTYAFEMAPTGASIDSATGKIRWTPSITQLGINPFIIVVRDGTGMVAKQSFHVDVASPSANTAPVLIDRSLRSAQVGVKYNTAVHATDADRDLLSYSMLSGPPNASITSDGYITWTPTELGSQSLRVQVSDSRGGFDEYTYSLDVGSTPVESSIAFTSSAKSDAVADRVYAYDAIAPGAVRYQLLSAPIGLSIDPVLGRIRWKPTMEQIGLTTIRVQAIDELGNTAEQTFSIGVRRADAFPAITSFPPTQISVGATYVYLAQASNPSGNPLAYTLSMAPQGMLLNPQTGALSWTPTASQTGIQSVILRVTDGIGNYLTQSFSIMVTASSPNRQPVSTSQPPQDATIASPIAYRFSAVDPDGDDLIYSVLAGPTGLTIDSTTGSLSWTPSESQIGQHAITLRASDPFGAAAVQSFLIDVRGANRSPSIVSVAPKSLPQGGLFRYDVIATDPDRELLFYDLLTAPEGMTIDSLGRIRWQTSLDTSLGQRQISVRVTDGRNGSAVQDFSVAVIADTQPPRISILTSSAVLSPYNIGPSVVKVQSVDNVAVVNMQLFVDGQAVPLRSDGTADVYFSAPGNGKLLAYAFDPAGNRGSTTNKLLMCSGGEVCIPEGTTSLPQSEITNINDGDSVSGLVEVIGTAAASDFESYELTYRRSDQSTFTTIAKSTNAITNGVIGKWDTSLLENDSYVLRLESRDQFGGFSATEREIGVSGNMKLGNFRLSFADMTLPVLGIPITVLRTYDTLRADRSGDFGYGWRMEYRNTDLRTNLPKTGLEDQGIYAAFKPNTKVYLTLPGGKREGFTFTPDIKVLPGFGGNLVIATPRFTPDAGNKNKLTAGSGNLIVNERGELYASGGIPWNPGSPSFSGYTLTTPDGIQYKIDGTGNLTSATDRFSNTLQFSEAGITALGSGVQIVFERDAKGRTTKVIDPAGNSLQYAYNANGDLIRFTNRLGASHQFTYRTDRRHFLNTIIDPAGNTVAANQFASDGRLDTVTNALGHSTSMDYDLETQSATLSDQLGNLTTYYYDQQGNVIEQIDALGGSTRTTYDENNRPLTETDPLGRTTKRTFDLDGNLTSTTTPTGDTTRIVRNARGDVMAITDPLGRVEQTSYDSTGAKIGFTTSSGDQTTYVLSPNGNLVETRTEQGWTRFTYDAAGRITEERTSSGRVVRSQYNALGLPSQIITTTSTEQGSTSSVVEFTYDAEGRQLSEAVDGIVTNSSSFDSQGNIVRSISNGIITTNTFTPDNRIASTQTGDGAITRYVYDAAGKLAEQIDSIIGKTTYQYDAVGRTVAVIYPDDTPNDLNDNPKESFSYDLAGQKTSETSIRNGRIDYTYDANSRLIKTTTPTNEDYTHQYDAGGRVIATTDPDGKTTHYTYDLLDQVVAKKESDGSQYTRFFNDQGQLVSETDPTGAKTSFAYNALGLIDTATDREGNSTRYQYSESGTLSQITDAAGNRTQFQYDALGNQTKISLPLGQSFATEYSASGFPSKTTDADGRTRTFTYNELQLPIRDETQTDVIINEIDSLGNLISSTGPLGKTQYTYDDQGLILEVLESDGRFIRYRYDTANRVTQVATPHGQTEYTYDENGRVVRVIDSKMGTTDYQYDRRGLLTKESLSSGLERSYTYDAQAQVASISIHKQSLEIDSYRYQYDTSGRIIQVQEHSGKVIEYEYSTASRLTEERVFQDSFLTQKTQYSYSAVGNRTLKIDSLLGTTAYTYDANDRLLSESLNGLTTTYQYDLSGNLIRKQEANGTTTEFFWNARGWLVRAAIHTATTTQIVDYSYDGQGNLVRRTVDGVATNFLLDKLSPVPRVLEVSTPSNTSRQVYGVLHLGMVTDDAIVKIASSDRHSGIRKLVSTEGSVLSEQTFDSYGNLKAHTGEAIDFQFRGEFRDPLTGLLYLRARHYDATTGRFISRDPSPGTDFRPESLNDYQYADNDPINNFDPTGQYSLPELSTVLRIVNSFFVTFSVYNVVKASAEYRAGRITASQYATTVAFECFAIFGPHVLGYVSRSSAGRFLGNMVYEGYSGFVRFARPGLEALSTNYSIVLSGAANVPYVTKDAVVAYQRLTQLIKAGKNTSQVTSAIKSSYVLGQILEGTFVGKAALRTAEEIGAHNVLAQAARGVESIRNITIHIVDDVIVLKVFRNGAKAGSRTFANLADQAEVHLIGDIPAAGATLEKLRSTLGNVNKSTSLFFWGKKPGGLFSFFKESARTFSIALPEINYQTCNQLLATGLAAMEDLGGHMVTLLGNIAVLPIREILFGEPAIKQQR